MAGTALQLGIQFLKLLWLSRAENFELRGSSLLLCGRLRNWLLVRFLAILAGGIATPLAGFPFWLALLLALGGEAVGRWLFFVSVVPKNMAASFAAGRKAA